MQHNPFIIIIFIIIMLLNTESIIIKAEVRVTIFKFTIYTLHHFFVVKCCFSFSFFFFFFEQQHKKKRTFNKSSCYILCINVNITGCHCRYMPKLHSYMHRYMILNVIPYISSFMCTHNNNNNNENTQSKYN